MISAHSFTHRVLAVVRAIPKGETRSYGAVARAAGSPHAARAVGSIMRGNKDRSVPCHRVVPASGGVGKYNGLRGPSKKRLLEREAKSTKEKNSIRKKI
jgi:methylated-DNA-[protein]-cysteine S-methyltransferase